MLVCILPLLAYCGYTLFYSKSWEWLVIEPFLKKTDKVVAGKEYVIVGKNIVL